MQRARFNNNNINEDDGPPPLMQRWLGYIMDVCKRNLHWLQQILGKALLSWWMWLGPHHPALLWMLQALAANTWLVPRSVVYAALERECQQMWNEDQHERELKCGAKRIQALALGVSKRESRRGEETASFSGEQVFGKLCAERIQRGLGASKIESRQGRGEAVFCAAEPVFGILCRHWFMYSSIKDKHWGWLSQTQDEVFQQLITAHPELQDCIPEHLYHWMAGMVNQKGFVVELFLLHNYKMKRNPTLLKTLLNVKTHSNGQTPLHFAVQFRFDQFRILRFYLENGAEVDARDKAGNTPLLTMICHQEHFEWHAIKVLLEYGADICAANAKGQSALTLLCHERDLVKKVLALGVSVMDEQGQKAIVRAAHLGCPDSVHLLLEAHMIQGGLF